MSNHIHRGQGGIVIIALGSNLSSPAWGSPRETLERALTELVSSGIAILKVSRTYLTQAHSHAPLPDFLNAVVATTTSMSAGTLLQVLMSIEAGAGRTRANVGSSPHCNIPPYYSWRSRPLDLDIICYKRCIWNWRVNRPLQNRRVILPHPRAHERAFVLKPLSEIAPYWHHPVFGLTAAALLKNPHTRETGRIVCEGDPLRLSNFEGDRPA